MSSNPYDVQVEKLECVGLIQNSMGACLLTRKSETKLSDRKSLRGRNQLTDILLSKIQRYYAGRGRLTSFSVEYKIGNQSLFECAESFSKKELRLTCHYTVFEDNMSSCRTLRGGESFRMMEAEWSARRVACQLGCSDSVVRRCWDQWI
ncbi:uncharacterized protein TNCV_3784481 [Trichonephila clavipes]|nr:uncharacterized protein TNCV_3784481 [Trichonephila clavipes]